jgi:hypothetical protein
VWQRAGVAADLVRRARQQRLATAQTCQRLCCSLKNVFMQLFLNDFAQDVRQFSI